MPRHDALGDLSIDLQELARHRDAPAPDRLARTVHRLVQRYCRARLGALPSGYALADHLADHVAADVATVILHDRRRRSGRPLPVEAVVYPMMADAVSRALAEASASDPDHAPSRTARPGRTSPAASAVPDGVAVPADASVLAELNSLPRRPRDVLVLRAFVGLSSEQVGRAMGLSTDKVRAEQHRAMAHLRSR